MPVDLPELALSVRQPWAWAIIYAGKTVENRSRLALRYMTYRGPIALHAAKGMTKAEYDHAAAFMATIGVECPPPHLLDRGCIIGCVTVDRIVEKSISPWFFGPAAFVLSGAASVAPIPAVGALGFFKWQPSGEGPDPAKKWMLPKAEAADVVPELLL